MNQIAQFVLTLSCPDVIGIVRAVSGFLHDRECNILDSTQHGDVLTGTFFMRIQFSAGAGRATLQALMGEFAPVAERFGMRWRLNNLAVRPRVLIMVSKLDHCLHDLLYRWKKGALAMDVPAVVSNHHDTRELVASCGIPFHHWPVTADSKRQQEQQLLDLVASERIDFVVLARYMQVLSDDVCRKLAGRVINIHHSFLPGFKGARPYHQAYERGVKLIGATAHYVTPDLDEGPIIEQDVIRVDTQTPEQLAAMGRDIEQLVLSRAVRYEIEHRVILSGQRTVIFR
jgi:formyltetrahydrofolate deformylase